LVGDYLLAKGLLLSIDSDNIKLLKIMSSAVKDMSEGELLQMEKARLLNIDEAVYFDIIRQKTATLISSACSVGIASVTKMRDDLFDLGQENTGKPRGIDIKEKKLTLPIIYALNNTDKSTQKYIKGLIKKQNKKKVAEVIDFIHQSGGIEYTKQLMQQYEHEAIRILETFPDNEGKIGLQQLITYTTERKR